jgi:surface antigen
MSFPRGGRRPRRVIGGALVVAVTATGLMFLAPASHADDDYPYRGLGQCPLVPLKPHHHAQHPTGPGHHPTKPGHPHQPAGPGKPHKPGHGPATKPDTPPPPRECARHIWYYQGSYGDPWGFALRNCTSFVAWRLREANGLADFSNHMNGGAYGDARNWDDNAKALGYLVDDVPAVGAVAQTDDGRVGHVAWVAAVGDGTVTVEEYNYAVAGGYDVRTVPASDFRYLHLADLAPAPSLGANRAATSTLDAQGRTWWVRSTPDGDVLVGGPVRHPLSIGPAGSWSPDATPALTTDAHGRTWLAAVSSSGLLLTAHTKGDHAWTRPRSLGGGWSTTAAPSLGVDGGGRLHLVAVTATGTLAERQTTGLRWRRGARMGAAGSWATHASPALVTATDGRLWLSAVSADGTLQARHQRGHGRWSRFDSLGRDWSVSSTPALAATDDGRVWLTAVSAHGELSVRSTSATGGWHSASATGRWSPYSSPALGVDSIGRLWLAAERLDGQVVVRTTRPHTAQWRPERALGRADKTASTTVTPLAVAGVRVGALSRSGRPRWWTVGLPSTSMAGAVGAHGGSFSPALRLRIP